MVYESRLNIYFLGGKMLDIKKIRENPEEVKKALSKRNYEVDFDVLLNLDEQRKALITEVEQLKAARNKASKEVGQIKREGGDASHLFEEMKRASDTIKELDVKVAEVDAKVREFVEALPNMPDDDVVAGGKENNQVVKTFGEKPNFDFEFKNHVDLATNLKLIDYERGVKLGGNGFWLYSGMGAQIEWALLNYFVAEHTKDGYEFILPPHMLNYECGYSAGQFPKFEEDVFRLQGDKFMFMLPTAETALINLYRDEILLGEELPKRLFAYTPCYRREAGSYRTNERGMIRGHQFNKVEMFAFTKPEESDALQKELIDKACRLVEGLGLHYQLTKLAAGDVSASMACTYDIEIWMPSMDEYKEVSSVSNSRDYQARRASLKFRRKGEKKPELMHTINGSGLATSRLFPAILEQNQQADGSVVVPGVLQKFIGTDVLKP